MRDWPVEKVFGPRSLYLMRDALIRDYDYGTTQTLSRSLVVRDALTANGFTQAEYYKVFVLMEYFDYLWRDPDAGGYSFWLNTLSQAPGNYRGMVCSFITSVEYQKRFGEVVSHTNGEGSPLSAQVGCWFKKGL
jgi:hypothetical protein